MRFDSRDLTVKLWADTSEACCGCSDTQPMPKCDGCTGTQPGCGGCSATPPPCQGCSGTQYHDGLPAGFEVQGGALGLLHQQLRQTLAGEAR